MLFIQHARFSPQRTSLAILPRRQQSNRATFVAITIELKKLQHVAAYILAVHREFPLERVARMSKKQNMRTKQRKFSGGVLDASEAHNIPRLLVQIW